MQDSMINEKAAHALVEALCAGDRKIQLVSNEQLLFDELFKKAASIEPRIVPYICCMRSKGVYNGTNYIYDMELFINGANYPDYVTDVMVADSNWSVKTLFKANTPLDSWIVTKNYETVKRDLTAAIKRFKDVYEGVWGISPTYFNSINYAGYSAIYFKVLWYLDREKIQMKRQDSELEIRKIWHRLLGKSEAPVPIKVLMAYNYLNTVCSYDHEASSKKENVRSYSTSFFESHISYGPVIKKQGVCEGLAWAFKRMMDIAGIPCVIVSGGLIKSKSIDHCWNQVKLSDGNWYFLDVTVNVGTSKTVSEAFLRTEEEFKRIRKWDTDFSYPTNGDSESIHRKIKNHIKNNVEYYRDNGADLDILTVGSI